MLTILRSRRIHDVNDARLKEKLDYHNRRKNNASKNWRGGFDILDHPVIGVGGIFIAVVGALFLILAPVTIVSTNQHSLWALKLAGQALGHNIENAAAKYQSFGDGPVGKITIADQAGNNQVEFTNATSRGSIIFSPMNNASSANPIQSDSTGRYGIITRQGGTGEGVGVIAYTFNPETHKDDYLITLVSGNYGTKSTGNDKSWCLVLKENREYMKFTNTMVNQVHSTKPISCLNGK